ncbi:MAG: ABC transporter ATP-binding protein [Verrucomicrobiota bacterium]|nr:ABC transporter ATP-binding protein [Verrucomicrobiota bacterium]
MASLSLETISKIYFGKTRICAVTNLNLEVQSGELLVLIGPSGCGKTTTLRLIAGLEKLTAGEISIDHKIMNSVSPPERDIAMVFQNAALFPQLNVFENIAFGLKLRKVAPAAIKNRIEKTAEMLGLKNCFHQKPNEISGGQAQRAALARALVREPEIFLFDEPLSNLDAPTRIQLRREIVRLQKRLGVTMIYVTHDQSEAMAMGNRIAVMKNGEIQQVAAPLKIYHRPATRFVAEFFGAPPMNFFPGVLMQKKEAVYFERENFSLRLSQDSGDFKNFIGKKIILGIRPENIEVQTGEMNSENTVEAAIEAIEPMGAQTHLVLKREDQTFIASVYGCCQLELNQKIFMIFDMARAHFFDAETERRLP